MPEKVLIVDDGHRIREFLAEYILLPKGYDVIMAEDGQEGLEKAIAEKPDLIIVDNQMPRMSGLGLLRALGERELSIPAILATAFGSEETAVEAFRLGVRDYVIKPFDYDEIDRAIEDALRESRLERERDRLLEELKESNRLLEKRVLELNTLYGMGKSVSASLDLERVLQRVVEAAVYITQAEEGFLMLMDQEQGELYVRASKNLDSQTRTMRLRVRDSLAGQVLRTKRSVVAGESTHWQKIKSTYLVRALIYVPLIFNDEAIGVLGLVNRQKEVQFKQHDMRVLSPLADYAAAAINNASLYRQSDAERNKLSTILRQTSDPILVVGPDGKLVLSNDAARIAFALPARDLVGRSVGELLAENSEALEFVNQPAGQDFSLQGEIQVQDGRIFNANMTLIEGVGRSIVMQDITQFKELDRLKSEFVSVVSHDLRSPLTSILGYIQLLERAGELNETQRDFVRRVQASVSSITSLITDLLDLGRLEAGLGFSPAVCDPIEVLLEISEELQVHIINKSIELNLSLPNEPVHILGDRRRLHQAFTNLANNAIKYTSKNGKVSFYAHVQEKQVIIQFSDTGVGISAADQPYIFDKFYRAENILDGFEGTGLGLSIVKSVIERHNGRVWVNSELSKGTTFTVVLPSIEAAIGG